MGRSDQSVTGPASGFYSGRLATILEKAGLLPPEDIAAAVAQAQQQRRPLWQIVLNDKKVSEEKLAEALARDTDAPYVRLAVMTVDSEVMQLVPKSWRESFSVFH